MREGEFRGKRLDNVEWITGDLIRMSGYTFIFPDPAPNGFDRYMVDPATVGQYTGLKDKTGKDIWGGDVLKWARDGRLYVVKLWMGMFYASVEECNKGIYGGFPLYVLTENGESGSECDIVGNIHDNPELLKTE